MSLVQGVPMNVARDAVLEIKILATSMVRSISLKIHTPKANFLAYFYPNLSLSLCVCCFVLSMVDLLISMVACYDLTSNRFVQ